MFRTTASAAKTSISRHGRNCVAAKSHTEPSGPMFGHLTKAAAALTRAQQALRLGHLEATTYELKKVSRITRETRTMIGRLLVNANGGSQAL
jgi:hypothetical protein